MRWLYPSSSPGAVWGQPSVAPEPNRPPPARGLRGWRRLGQCGAGCAAVPILVVLLLRPAGGGILAIRDGRVRFIPPPQAPGCPAGQADAARRNQVSGMVGSLVAPKPMPAQPRALTPVFLMGRVRLARPARQQRCVLSRWFRVSLCLGAGMSGTSGGCGWLGTHHLRCRNAGRRNGRVADQERGKPLRCRSRISFAGGVVHSRSSGVSIPGSSYSHVTGFHRLPLPMSRYSAAIVWYASTRPNRRSGPDRGNGGRF